MPSKGERASEATRYGRAMNTNERTRAALYITVVSGHASQVGSRHERQRAAAERMTVRQCGGDVVAFCVRASSG